VSALGVKLRTRQITEREAHSAIDAYTRLVSPSLRRIKVDDEDHRKAVILLEGWRTALRAGYGLHLAIADAHRATIFTFDQGMAKAGATLGIAVRLLEINIGTAIVAVDQEGGMGKNRLEPFSDGVIAIIITIMVLELKVPHGATFDDLLPLLPTLGSYVLSFIYIFSFMQFVVIVEYFRYH
jgi:hypothetical protein